MALNDERPRRAEAPEAPMSIFSPEKEPGFFTIAGISPAKQNPPARTGGHSTHARHTPLLLLGGKT